MERDSVGRRGDGLVFNFHETGVPKVPTRHDCLLASKHSAISKLTPSVAPQYPEISWVHMAVQVRLRPALPCVLYSVERVRKKRTCTTVGKQKKDRYGPFFCRNFVDECMVDAVGDNEKGQNMGKRSPMLSSISAWTSATAERYSSQP